MDITIRQGSEAIAANMTAARADLCYVDKHYSDIDSFMIRESRNKGLMLIYGSQAVSLGAHLSNCRFYAGTLMPPSTGIFYINRQPTFEEGVPVIRERPLLKHSFSMETIKEEILAFY